MFYYDKKIDFELFRLSPPKCLPHFRSRSRPNLAMSPTNNLLKGNIEWHNREIRVIPRSKVIKKGISRRE